MSNPSLATSIVAAHVTPEAAAAVLAVEGHHLGRSPGTFAERLISLVKAADQANRAFLAQRFRDYVDATVLAQSSDGLDVLVGIVTADLDAKAGADCAECGRGSLFGHRMDCSRRAVRS